MEGIDGFLQASWVGAIMAQNGDTQICGCCCGLLARIIGFGVAVAYAVFGIKTLRGVSNGSVRNTCAGSTLWSALLVQVIFAVSGALKAIGCVSGGEKNRDSLLSTLASLAVLTGLASWGVHETFSSCVKKNFGDSDIRLMTMGWSLAVFALLALCILCLLAICIMGDRLTRLRDRVIGIKPTINDAVADAEGVDSDSELGTTTTAGVIPEARTAYEASP